VYARLYTIVKAVSHGKIKVRGTLVLLATHLIDYASESHDGATFCDEPV
jgi:hypothetical protein